MKGNLDDFLRELAEEGDAQGTSSGFTLRSDKAREKLKKFALAHPESYFLLVLAALHALNARNFSLRVDADDLEVRGDCTLERSELSTLWENVAGGKEGSIGSALRLLGLAILTSVRFAQVNWTLESRDAEGSFRFQQAVRGEELPEPRLETIKEEVEGTVVRVKRKDVKTVVSRFFTQLARQLGERDWDEEELIRQRVFFGALENIAFNGRKLDFQMSGSRASVVYKVGGGPDFMRARYEFAEDGDQNTLVILGREPGLPGESKKVSWIWHGLKMGETRLGLSYDFCRAFSVADELQCDLSLTELADTWARQKAVRQAREAVRRALELAAQRYLELQKDQWYCQDREMEGYLLEVAAKRINIQRSRHRLGSFNETLIRCPFFSLKDPLGVRRRANLFEIWEMIEKGKHPALFRTREEWTEVDAWPDRPAVIFGEKAHSDALIEIFGEKAFHSGKSVARSVSKLKQEGRVFQPPRSSGFAGEIEIEGHRLSWNLDPAGGAGSLVVLRGGRVYFEENVAGLPQGFQIYGEAAWEPNFGGRMADESLKKRLVEEAKTALGASLAMREGDPDASDFRAGAILLRALGPDWAGWFVPGVGDRSWLVVRTDKLRRMSPNDYRKLVDQEELAYYYTTCEAAGRAEARDSLPAHLVVDPSGIDSLPAGFHDVQGVQLLSARPPFQTGELKRWRVVYPALTGLGIPGLQGAAVGYPTKQCEASGVVLELNLRGHKLQSRQVNSFVGPAIVCLELDKGWPDSRGRHLIDKEQMEALKSMLPEILTVAGRTLWTEASPTQLDDLQEEVQRTVLIDLWSEGDNDWEKRIHTAGGARVSIAELRNRVEIHYFSDWSRAGDVPAESVFFSAIQVEALTMVAEQEVWIDELASRPAAPRPGPEPEITKPAGAPPAPKPLTKNEQKAVAAAPAPLTEPAPEPLTQAIPAPEPALEPLTQAIQAPEPALEPLTQAIQAPDRPSQTALPEAQEPAKPETTEAPSQPTADPEPSPDSPAGTEPPLRRGRERPPMGPTVTALSELLGEIQQGQKVPFPREFQFVVSSTREVQGLASVLKLEHDKLVVRSLENPTPEQLLALLSALYSHFNRSLDTVEDSHEREFHLALVKHAGRGWIANS